jgi:hypothetical protein
MLRQGSRLRNQERHFSIGPPNLQSLRRSKTGKGGCNEAERPRDCCRRDADIRWIGRRSWRLIRIGVPAPNLVADLIEKSSFLGNWKLGIWVLHSQILDCLPPRFSMDVLVSSLSRRPNERYSLFSRTRSDMVPRLQRSFPVLFQCQTKDG